MNDNLAKTICTIAVRIATAMIFTFGVFRFNWTDVFAGILWAFVASVLAVASVKATRSIWGNGHPDKTSQISSNQPPKA